MLNAPKNELVLVDANNSSWAERLLTELNFRVVYNFDCTDDARKMFAEVSADDRTADPFALVVAYPSPKTSKGEPDPQATALIYTHVRRDKTIVVYITPIDKEMELRLLLGDRTDKSIMVFFDAEFSIDSMIKLLKKAAVKNLQ